MKFVTLSPGGMGYNETKQPVKIGYQVFIGRFFSLPADTPTVTFKFVPSR